MSIHDKELEDKLLKTLEKLERQVDRVGPTPLRRSLDNHLIAMRREIRAFDQDEYEGTK